MLTKLLYGIAALVLAIALAVVGVQTYRLSGATRTAQAALKRAETAEGSLASLQAVLAARTKSDKLAQDALADRARRAEEQAVKAKKEANDLRKALDASPGWADSPIPDGVRSALQD